MFKDVAARGKTSVDCLVAPSWSGSPTEAHRWFFGWKLHSIINDKGELLNFQVTHGNVDDRKPVPDLLQHSLWVDCLLPSTQEARNRYAAQSGLFCLTRTHVN